MQTIEDKFETFRQQIKSQMKQDKQFKFLQMVGNISEIDSVFYLDLSHQLVPIPVQEEDEILLLKKAVKQPQHAYVGILEFQDLNTSTLCMVFEKGSDEKGFQALEIEVISKYLEIRGIEVKEELKQFLKET